MAEGDTLTLVTREGTKFRVRLFGIGMERKRPGTNPRFFHRVPAGNECIIATGGEGPETVKSKRAYRVIFHNQGNVYELHARKVSQGDLYSFVEVEDILFGERGGMLVDPSEEKLKSEFASVKRTYIPLQAIVRIDEVEKEGVNKIIAAAETSCNITPFPMPVGPTGGKPPKG